MRRATVTASLVALYRLTYFHNGCSPRRPEPQTRDLNVGNAPDPEQLHPDRIESPICRRVRRMASASINTVVDLCRGARVRSHCSRYSRAVICVVLDCAAWLPDGFIVGSAFR
jgi:hypothetical protein